MKALAAFFLGTLPCAAVLACGGSTRQATPSSSARGSSTTALTRPASPAPPKLDRDGDPDNNNDDQHVIDFGHVAGATEAATITALIHHYYAAAASENGTKACALLAPFVAETVVERDGHSSALRGRTCAAVMSKLFGLQHALLVGKRAHLQIVRIGVEGNRSLVAIEFPEIARLRQITARRVGSRWTMLTLLDGIIE